MALKKFAKNKEIYNEYLKGVQFDELSKEEATELIGKCYDHVNGNETTVEDEDEHGDGEFEIKFSANYKNSNGSFGTVILSDEELVEVRQAHRQHCEEIYNQCVDDYPGDSGVQIAMFEKRADKIFTWIQQELDEKVRQERK
jgi:hypothetical protein